MHASCRYHCKICRKFYLFRAFDSPKAKIVGESMRNQDKQARKFGVFSPFFWKIFITTFWICYIHLLMLMIFPMLIVMRLLMKWKTSPETWKLKCNVIMEAKYKPNHVVCNLVVNVLTDGLVHLLQYPDFCAIGCCFFTLLPTMCTSNAYSLTSVMHRVSSEWSRWEMSADDVLFSTRCHNYLAEKICYQNENRKKKIFFLYKLNLWKF